MKRIGILLLAVCVTLSLHAKEAPQATKGYANFIVRVMGGTEDAQKTFVIRIPGDKKELIDQARAKIYNSDHRQVVIGTLADGNAGYNKGWSWHIIPETIDLVDTATEVCDAEPSYVEDNLDAWIKSKSNPNAVGYYCPWNAEIIAEIGDEEMPPEQNATKKPEQAG